MKRKNRIVVAALAACMAFGAYAVESNVNWEYDESAKTISDGVWKFSATKSGSSNLTIGGIADDGHPTEVSPLNFSKKVVKKGDASTEYTIVNIGAMFYRYDQPFRAGGEYVGEVTLPGDGLVKLDNDGLWSDVGTNVCGDIIVPSTVTEINRRWFVGTKITSVTFDGCAATINGAYDGAAPFQKCTALTSVVFTASANCYMISGYTFQGCSSLTDVDLSGVTNIVTGSETSPNKAHFGNCNALRRLIIGPKLVRFPNNVILGSGNNKSLDTIHFLGTPPAEFGIPYLNGIGKDQSVTTIVPAEFRNVTNSAGVCWTDYSATKKLNTTDSTFASAYVKSDVTDLSKRKLLLDKIAEDEPPSIEDPVATNVWAYQATVIVNGSDLKGGTVFVSLTNAVGTVMGPMELDNFGKSATFTGLTCDTQYSVIAVATNAYGTVTNATTSFTTLAKQATVGIAKGGDADFNTPTNGSFVISRADDDDTSYPLTVKYTIGGTAVAGTNYQAIAATTTIPLGEKSVTIDVVPLYCETQKGDTTVTLSLTDDPGYAVETREAAVNIKEVVVLHYSIAKGSDPTGESYGTFTVSRGADDPTDKEVTLTYTVTGTGKDVINALSGTVVIFAGETSATIKVFASNAGGPDAPLTVTLNSGYYKLDVSSASMTVTGGAASDYWRVDTSARTITWGGWVIVINYDASSYIGTVSCNGYVTAYPEVISPLDFSIPAVDPSGKEYHIALLSMKNAPEAMEMVGKLTLPTKGLTKIVQDAFNGCTNLTGDLMFPSSLTDIERYAFNNTKVTSVDFVTDVGSTCTLGQGVFQNCKELEWARFADEGNFTVGAGNLFNGCAALGDADFSGVVSVTVNNSASTFSGCSALTNLVLNSKLVLTNTGAAKIGYALFSGNTSLSTIRFTGKAPDELQNWINTDSGYLSVLSSSQPITTIVPVAYRNVQNTSGKCWTDYSAAERLNTIDSTWAATNVASGVTDLANRMLLLDAMPEDEPPYVQNPVLSSVTSNDVVVTVGGDGLYGGKIYVALTNALGALGPKELNGFGESCSFDSLAPDTEYAVIVIAYNASGSTTNTMSVFKTLPPPGQYWFYDATGSEAVISNGIWTFRATVSGTDMTVKTAVDDTEPSLCPTEISPLNFSLPVIDIVNREKRYTIVKLATAFLPNGGSKRASADFVGELTLPGEGFEIIDGEAFQNCNNLYGDLVVPRTVTHVYRYSFQNSKITSITFEAATADINAEVFTGCHSLTSVVFKAGGNWTIMDNSRPFNGCWHLKDVDLSGVISVGGDDNHAAFGSCTDLSNITLNSGLVMTNTSSGSIWNALFNGAGNLETVRFTGAAPDELDKWVAGDNQKYLDCLSASKNITTIIPAASRNVANVHGKSWADYAEGRLNAYDSTWKAVYVTVDPDKLALRKLILDSNPEDEPPTITSCVASNVWAYQATVAVDGYGINGGAISVSLTNALGEVAASAELDDFGKSHTFTGLNCDTTYAAVVIATNAYGSVTNDVVVFTTLARQATVSVVKGGDADINKSQNGSFVISREDDDDTSYPLTVKYTIGGTAVAGTDYTELPATVTILEGVTSVTVDVVPLYNASADKDTAVILSLIGDHTYSVDEEKGSATVDVKKAVVYHYSIKAGTGPTAETPRGTFIVSRGANDPIDQKVTLTYTISGAGANAIFPLSGTVVIAPYATSATIDVFGNNKDGSAADLTVTLDSGNYVLDTASATNTVAAGAASECWRVDTSAKTISWRDWTFAGVDTGSKTVTMGNNSLKNNPTDISPLDFSLPVVDDDGNRYVILQISARGASAVQKNAIGELTLPGEGFKSTDYAAFSGCANISGKLVFPTSFSGLGGESFKNCSKITIVGSSITGWATMTGKEPLTGVSFEGEALALSFTEIDTGVFYNSKVGSVRFGPGLKKLCHGANRDGFFKNCTSLTNVVFDPDSRVTLEHGEMFYGCTALKEIDLSPVTNITCGITVYTNDKQVVCTNVNLGTFYNCSALTNVIFGADLHYLASNVFENAFDSKAAKRTITFKGLPPEGFEMPYLAKANASDAVITTFVQSRYLSKKNSAGKCWTDYAEGGKIGCSQSSTWASAYLPDGVDSSKRPLCIKKGLVIILE